MLPKAAAKVEMSPASSESTSAFLLCLRNMGGDVWGKGGVVAAAAAVSVWGGNGTAVSSVSKAVVLLEEDVMFCNIDVLYDDV